MAEADGTVETVKQGYAFEGPALELGVSGISQPGEANDGAAPIDRIDAACIRFTGPPPTLRSDMSDYSWRCGMKRMVSSIADRLLSVVAPKVEADAYIPADDFCCDWQARWIRGQCIPCTGDCCD